jgi:hypothetical protein
LARIFAVGVSSSLNDDARDERDDDECGDGAEEEIESTKQREEQADVAFAHHCNSPLMFCGHRAAAQRTAATRSPGAPATVNSVPMAKGSSLA